MKRIFTCVILAIACGVNAQINSSLTACYALNGDASEPINGLTGTLTGVSTITDRNNNNNSAVSFSGGVGSYIKLPGNAKLRTGELSFSAWLKPANVGGSSQYIVFTKNTGSSNFEAYALVVNTGSFVVVKGAAGNVAQVTTTSAIAANQWHHVAFSFDNTQMKVYLNGNLEATTNSTIVPDYDTGKDVILGGSNETFNLPYSGAIDNARFYNRVLSTAEISQLYSQDPACQTTPTGVDAVEGAITTSIYPNPSSGVFHVHHSSNLAYRVFDITGNVVADGILNADQTILDLSQHPSGIYLLETAGNSSRCLSKIIKE
jgi:hypothetical protein